MIRLYSEGLQGQPGERVIFEGMDYNHVVNVTRHKVGDSLKLFNADAGEWVAHVRSITRHELMCEVVSQVRQPLGAGRDIHLAAARLKPDAWGWMLEKATELGVTYIHPLVSERVQQGRAWQHDKWLSIMKGAAQQCERLDIPVLCEPQTLEDFIKTIHENVSWHVALERSDAPLLVSMMGNVGIIIGPEGGFSKYEADMLVACSRIKAIALGSNILRAETAAIAGLAVLSLGLE